MSLSLARLSSAQTSNLTPQKVAGAPSCVAIERGPLFLASFPPGLGLPVGYLEFESQSPIHSAPWTTTPHWLGSLLALSLTCPPLFAGGLRESGRVPAHQCQETPGPRLAHRGGHPRGGEGGPGGSSGGTVLGGTGPRLDMGDAPERSLEAGTMVGMVWVMRRAPCLHPPCLCRTMMFSYTGPLWRRPETPARFSFPRRYDPTPTPPFFFLGASLICV